MLHLIYGKMLGEEPLPRLSKATTEAIFVGAFRNYEKLNRADHNTVNNCYITLRNDILFSVDALKEGLAATERVKARLDRAVEIFDV